MSSRSALIAALPAEQRLALIASCVERAVPVVRYFGSPAAAHFYEDCLQKLRQGASSTELNFCLKGLNRLPEASSRLSPNDLRVYARHALAVLAEGLHAVRASLDEKAVETACEAAQELYANLDFVLSPEFWTGQLVNPRNPPPPGLLESEELRAQDASLKHDLVDGADDERRGEDLLRRLEEVKERRQRLRMG